MAVPNRIPIGVPLTEFPAATENWQTDTIKQLLARPRGQKPPAPAVSPPHLPIQVKNATTTDIEPGHILGIGGPLFSLSDNPNEPYGSPMIEGVTPDASAHTNHFVAALDFIDAYEGESDIEYNVGPAVLIGAAFVKINWTDVDHTHCKVTTGETLLQSSPGGIKVWLLEEIPDAEYLPAELWGLVVLGGGGLSGEVNIQPGMTGGTITPADGLGLGHWGQGDVHLYTDFEAGELESEPQQGNNIYADSIPADTPCWVLFYGGYYFVINAGCNQIIESS